METGNPIHTGNVLYVQSIVLTHQREKEYTEAQPQAALHTSILGTPLKLGVGEGKYVYAHR